MVGPDIAIAQYIVTAIPGTGCAWYQSLWQVLSSNEDARKEFKRLWASRMYKIKCIDEIACIITVILQDWKVDSQGRYQNLKFFPKRIKVSKVLRAQFSLVSQSRWNEFYRKTHTTDILDKKIALEFLLCSLFIITFHTYSIYSMVLM